ncbi:hypothetical protein B0J11DRAFT_576681 [Dendryphion nanum]|uniref:Uncharacterized protein n=1 Tax=Dendryphion nanum TaxID=256645 RepID=A0A9P9EFG4_9PLEO|nr:hypothetical protein B0J11DRAFT_576681 [Dendryphion nanum]
MMITRRYTRILVACILFVFCFWFFSPNGDSRSGGGDYQPHHHSMPPPPHPVDDVEAAPPEPHEKELVVASLKGDDTKWLTEFFADWRKNIYVVNDASAPLTVVKNKGREAMPFLTYIIDRYDTLPNVSIFIHSLRYQWHNEDPMYDGVPVLKRLRLSHVQRRGYVALRCSWTMGCPAELHPLRPNNNAKDDRSQNEAAYAAAYRHIFPSQPVPDVVGAHCSSQFAVSRDRIHAQPRMFYEKIRSWIVETELDDQISGRVIEYMWHMIFGMDAVDCQDAGKCFCETFGLCNLTCSRDACEKRYQLPQFATIPEGWPEVGPGTDGWPAKGWAD